MRDKTVDHHEVAPRSAELPVDDSLSLIQELAEFGLSRVGSHGPVSSLGVPREQLPQWDSLQILTAQLASLPLLETESVETTVTIGPKAKKPLHLAIPLIVADMAFGSMSMESKVALARGAEQANTAICSGEGGMLPRGASQLSSLHVPSRFFKNGLCVGASAPHASSAPQSWTGSKNQHRGVSAWK